LLTSNANLYAEDSPVKIAFFQQDYGNLRLDLQNADHQKFIVDISFQLSKCERLGHLLQLEEYHIERIQADYSNATEQAYQLLRTYLSRMPNVTLGQLQHALKGLGVTGLALRTLASEEREPRWDSVCVNDEEFVRNLGVKLQYRWKFIGRLLELDEQDLNGIEYCNHEDLGEQSYQMLLFDGGNSVVMELRTVDCSPLSSQCLNMILQTSVMPGCMPLNICRISSDQLHSFKFLHYKFPLFFVTIFRFWFCLYLFF